MTVSQPVEGTWFNTGFTKRQALCLILFCAAITVGLWLAQVTPYLNVADDSGRYMVLGESIARTGDLRLINQVSHPLDTLYPPGFPAMIAAWMVLTGGSPASVVLPMKFTLLLMTLVTLPLMLMLLSRAKLRPWLVIGTMVAYAACPAVIGYSNEIMSDLPLLAFGMASVAIIDVDGEPGSLARVMALLFAVVSFTMRTSGIALLIALAVYYHVRFGRKWAAVAWFVTLASVGVWLLRNHHIAATHPWLHYPGYLDQFTLRNPMKMDAGRIPLSPLGLASRMKFGFPVYIGMIPRAVLYLMAPPHTALLVFFYIAAVPLCVAVLVGIVPAWHKGMKLTVGFSILFWFTAAMWPWQNARFLFPIVPFMLLFAALALQQLFDRIPAPNARMALGVLCTTVLFGYYGSVLSRSITSEKGSGITGYSFGRTVPEAGFYAACAWLKHNTPRNTLVMGKPAYLLHLYTGHPTTQIEPTNNARVQEKAYMSHHHLGYLVEDSWPFGFVTHKILAPYFKRYGTHWQLVWEDTRSGVKVWRRISGVSK